MVKIYYYKKETFKYLFSYLKEQTEKELELIEISGVLDVIRIENHEDNYLLFSNFILEDVRVMMAFIEMMRLSYPEIRINITIGGGAHYILDNQHLMELYPEITNICIGKGENFLTSLIEGKVSPGIHQAGDFGKLKRYRVSPEYTLDGKVLLTYIDNRCDWQKCRFCHHQSEFMLPVCSADYMTEDMIYYLDQGYREFLFYDNNLNPRSMARTLAGLRQKNRDFEDIKIHLLGLRVDADFTEFIQELEHWPQNPVQSGSWGIEFYHQEVLDNFRKNTRLPQIDEALELFHRLGIDNYCYLLFGLPLVRSEQIQEFLEFVKEREDLVHTYLTSFFLLDKGLDIYDNREDFGIVPEEPFTLRDYFGGDERVPALRTSFLKFQTWNEEQQRYLNREEELLRYKDFFDVKKVSTYSRFFFQSPDVEREYLRRAELPSSGGPHFG